MFCRPALLLCVLGGILFACPAFARKAPPPVPPPPPPLLKPISSGTFQDAAGHAHTWEITQDHVLDWDGSPYLPAGGAFTPRSWVDGQTDDTWNADVQALQTLRQHGVTDLLLTAGSLGLTRVPPAAVQRLLDYLDAHGFHYGLKIADFPEDPLVGYTIEPSVFRNPSPPEPGQVRFTHIGGLQDAFAVLASSAGERLETDQATVTPDGTAQVTIALSGDGGDTGVAGDVLLLYPRRSFGLGTPESHLPNLWQGYDEYRDRLITFFRHVHLGSGFRFFLDPLTDRIALNGEVQNLVPTSGGFQRDFEAWLDTKYGQNLDSMDQRWGVGNRDLPSFEVAARCIPLWYGLKGVPDLYDPVTKTAYRITNHPRIQSNYWDDLQEFKVASTRSYMDEIADALKSAVADVPVVYTWTQHSPLFTDSAVSGGYDGLGMEVYGHGAQLAHGAAAYAYAQAQETPKTTWLIVSATASAPPDQKSTPGFLSKAVLFDDWDALTRIGARGFYARSLQSLPASTHKNSNLVSLPNQLDWLNAYASMLTDSASVLDSSQPTVLWYPQNVAGADSSPRLLPDGVWWLPTFTLGRSLTLGPSLGGYTLTPPGSTQPMNVLWSSDGSVSTARFNLAKMGTPVATGPDGTPLRVSHKDDSWTFPVSALPTVVRGVAYLPLSQDAGDAAESEAERLLALAQKQKVDIGTLDQDLFRVSNDTQSTLQDVGPRYTQFEQIIHLLIGLLQPYAWVEGESSTNETFTAVAPDADASAGAYLSLNTAHNVPATDPAGGYHATYTFSVTAPGDYSFWMAGSLPGVSSPFTWQVDDGAPNPASALPPSDMPLSTAPPSAMPPSAVPPPDAPASAVPIPAPPAAAPSASSVSAPPAALPPAAPAVFSYGGKFTWRDLGSLHLARGTHTLTILVTSPSVVDQRYVLDIDAFCITRTAFTPNGPYQPPLDSWLPPAPPPTSKGKKGKH